MHECVCVCVCVCVRVRMCVCMCVYVQESSNITTALRTTHEGRLALILTLCLPCMHMQRCVCTYSMQKFAHIIANPISA